MTWESLTWIPLPERLPGGGTDLGELAGAVRSALDAALSQALGRPVVLQEVVAARWEGDLPDAFLPLASVELLGAPRHLVAVAQPPLPGGANPAEDPWAAAGGLGSVAGGLLHAADDAVTRLLGEGLAVGPSEGVDPDRSSLLVRLTWKDGQGRLLSLVLAVPEVAGEELVAHVAALRALASGPAGGSELGAAEETGASSGDRAPWGGSGALVADAAPAEGQPPTGPVATTPQEPPAAVPAVLAGDRRGGDGPSADAPGGASLASWSLPELGPGTPAPSAPNLELLLGVNLQVTVEIGRASLPIREILALGAGSIVELDKLAGDKVDVLVNGHLIAQGEVVVVDENFGVRITDVVSRQRRLLSADGAA